jgi:hypothetical protein
METIGLASAGASMLPGLLTVSVLGSNGCTIRLGEYDLITEAADLSQMTWLMSHPNRADAIEEKYGAPV